MLPQFKFWELMAKFDWDAKGWIPWGSEASKEKDVVVTDKEIHKAS